MLILVQILTEAEELVVVVPMVPVHPQEVQMVVRVV
jgi:hypothetical protein